MSLVQGRSAQSALSHTATATAKINLSLRITGRRADGYHLLESLVVFAEQGDCLAVRLPGPAEPDLSLSVEGPFAGQLSNEPDNLVLRAARALAESANITPRAALSLTKNLPVASGIGGGSADAAAALHLLNRLWGLQWPLAELQDLALPLGADIPVCLWGEPAVMRGIGEEIAPLAALPDFALLLANPGAAVSTGAIFAARQGSYSSPCRLPDRFIDFGTLLAWLAENANDLEQPARQLCPAVGEVLDALGRIEDCHLARMSGSGATCFGLFQTLSDAEAAAEALKRAYPAWWVLATEVRQSAGNL